MTLPHRLHLVPAKNAAKNAVATNLIATDEKILELEAEAGRALQRANVLLEQAELYRQAATR